MSEHMSVTHFKMMAVALGFRDLFIPPSKKIRETGMKEGNTVLDFGCGPGNITIAAARTVGPTGRVFALDKHPRALESVGKKARKKHLDNIKTFSSDGRINLPESSLDFVLLFDVFHDLSSPQPVLKEIYRVLKPEGKLAVNDHHLNKIHIKKRVEESGPFIFESQGRISTLFQKSGSKLSSAYSQY